MVKQSLDLERECEPTPPKRSESRDSGDWSIPQLFRRHHAIATSCLGLRKRMSRNSGALSLFLRDLPLSVEPT